MNSTTARHEAGHAVCAWYLGIEVASVQILRYANFWRGDWLKNRFQEPQPNSAGMTEYRRKLPQGIDFFAANGTRTIRSFSKMRIAVAYAGPIMSALHEGQSLQWALCIGGVDDAKVIKEECKSGELDRRAESEIILNTALFLTARVTQTAMGEIARKLEWFGAVKGAQLESICRQTFKVPGDIVHPCSSTGRKRLIDPRINLAPQLLG